MSNTSNIAIAVVGAGEIGRLTARELARHPKADVVAVADLNEGRARDLAALVKAREVVTDPEAVFAMDGIDAVYAAVPNAHHQAVACGALAGGKHLLLDKPFAIDLAAARHIAEAAEAAGRTLMIGMNQRFERNVQRARLLHAAGRFGDVYHVKAYWRRRQGIPRLGSWFTDKATAGGGALLDIGVHVLDVALHVLNDFDIASVSGAAFTRFGNRGLGEGGWGRSERSFERFDVDDFATAFVRLANGTVITLEAAWALHQPVPNDHDVILYGEDAGMAIYADTLFASAGDGGYQQLTGVPTPDLPMPHLSRAHHFVNVLLGDEQPLVTVDEALKVQAVLDAIYESSATGQEVRL